MANSLGLKEDIRDIYKAKDRKQAAYRFVNWRNKVPDDCKPFVVVKNTFEEWSEEIFNFFDYRFTNAYTESLNNIIKKLDKDGRSLSFEQLRFKALFSTKATKLPKFKYKEASYAPSNSFSNMLSSYSSFNREKILSQGFGVDLELLSELL